ncbi:MAG: DUF6056 family protein [Peptostreptococcus sp.]|uniref:DUF3329 domain-containing protein n=1 Tax=Peptostreptococcus sp. TaxID=1262 RepID=UPI002FC59B6C
MENKRNINYVSIIIFTLVFVLIFFLNVNTPFVADDFNNMFVEGNVRITNISQVISNQVYRYYNTNGRVISHTIGGIILMFDKKIINIINSIGFCLLLYIVYRYTDLTESYGRIKHKKHKNIIDETRRKINLHNALFVLLAFLLIWRFTPTFGQDFLWVIGAANYMWTNIILLSVLIIARKIAVLEKPIEKTSFLLFTILLSVIAGWTNENSVPAVLLILLYYIIKMYVDGNKDIISMVFIFFSMLSGFLIMITAPGNFKRVQFFNEPDELFLKYFLRLSKMNENFTKYFLILLLISIALVILARFIHTGKSIETEVYLIAALVSFYAMIMAPTYPCRVMVITVLLFTISIVMNISIIARINSKLSIIIMTSAILVFGYYFSQSYPEALKDSSEYYSRYNAREMIIKDNKNMGHIDEIQVPEITSDNPYTAAYGLEDCKYNKEDWINVTIARYYGVNSVVLRE